MHHCTRTQQPDQRCDVSFTKFVCVVFITHCFTSNLCTTTDCLLLPIHIYITLEQTVCWWKQQENTRTFLPSITHLSTIYFSFYQSCTWHIAQSFCIHYFHLYLNNMTLMSSSQIKYGQNLFWPGYSLSPLETWKYNNVLQICCWPRSSKSNGGVATCSFWTGLGRFCLSLFDISSNPDGTFIPTWLILQRLLHWNKFTPREGKDGVWVGELLVLHHYPLPPGLGNIST